MEDSRYAGERCGGCFQRQEPLDIVVPINQIDAFVNFVNAFEKECGMRMISFGHAGDGNVHLCVVRGDRDDETWGKKSLTLI